MRCDGTMRWHNADRTTPTMEPPRAQAGYISPFLHPIAFAPLSFTILFVPLMWYSLPMGESLYQKFTFRGPSIELLETLAELIDFESASLEFEPQLVCIELNNSEILTKKRLMRQKWSSWLESWRRHEKQKKPFKPHRRISLAKRINSTTKLILKNKHNENYELERRMATLLDMVSDECLNLTVETVNNLERESHIRDNESCKNVAQEAEALEHLRDQLHCQRELQVSRYYKYFAIS